MAYTTPKTWSSELVTVTDMNTYIRDNMLALKDPPSDNYESDEGADYTTTSTGWAQVDADWALTITTTGGDVMLGFVCSADNNTAGEQLYFNVYVSSLATRVVGDDGICTFEMPTSTTSRPQVVSFMFLLTGLSAGSHTFTLQWKVSGGTGKIYAGAGTSGYDVHPQFWAREVS